MDIDISKENILTEYEKLKLQRRAVNSKIQKFQVGINISQKKKEELFHFGKFLTQFEDEIIEIIVPFESPDFIINANGKRTGLEIIYLLDQKVSETVRPISNLFKEAEKLFSIQYPSIKILANIYLFEDRLVITQKNRKELIQIINDCILGLINDENHEKPNFIRDIYVDPCPHLYYSYNPDINSVQLINQLILNKTIQKKEKLIETYKKETGIEDFWLLIILGQLSPDSFKINEPVPEITKSKFERIYLFEDFELKKHRIK